MSERRLRISSAITCAVLTFGGVAPRAAAQPLFSFEALPELPGAASEAYANAAEDEILIGGNFAVGRSLDDDGLWKAVVWSRGAGAVLWELVELPNPFGATESAALAADYVEDLFRRAICGYADDEEGHPQPVVWTQDGDGPWSAEVAPIPPPYDTGGIQFMDKAELVDLILKNRMAGVVGTSDGSTAHHAVVWTRDLVGGSWSVDLPPDYGPAFASKATGTGRTIGHIANISIGGHVLPDTGAGIQPSVWDVLPGGVITRIELPLAPGAYLGSIEALASGAFGGLAAVGYDAHPGGFDFYKPVVYARIGGVWGDALELPPLPGQRDARAASALPGRASSAEGLTVLGGSYSELAPGDGSRATLWEIAVGNDDQPVVAATYDLADLVVDLPPGVAFLGGALLPGAWIDLAPVPRATAPTIFEQTVFVAGSSTLLGDPGATPHAYLLTSLPEPSGSLVSGAALLALLARRRARSQNAGAGSELTIHIAK